MKRTTEYLGFRGGHCDIVTVNGDWYDYRPDEEGKIPKKGAFCKHCKAETAKPVYSVYMSGKPAYALQCNKCKNEYVMYKDMYTRRYIGYNTNSGGHINPTHGTLTVTQAMDRKAREELSNRRKKVDEYMCKYLNCAPEEYAAKREKWDKERRISAKNIKADISLRIENDRINSESAKRKELIEKGCLST